MIKSNQSRDVDACFEVVSLSVLCERTKFYYECASNHRFKQEAHAQPDSESFAVTGVLYAISLVGNMHAHSGVHECLYMLLFACVALYFRVGCVFASGVLPT